MIEMFRCGNSQLKQSRLWRHAKAVKILMRRKKNYSIGDVLRSISIFQRAHFMYEMCEFKGVTFYMVNL